MSARATTVAPEQLQALLNGPAGEVPKGAAYNVKNPESLTACLIATLTIIETLGTLTILTRLYTKRFIMRSLAYEDYAATFGWVSHDSNDRPAAVVKRSKILQFAGVIPSIISTNHGAGSHMWDIKLGEFFDMLYWSNLCAIIYSPTIFFIKLSILLQYHRIFVPDRTLNMPMFLSIRVLIWACLIFYTIFTVIGIFECIPRSKIWRPLTTDGHCFNTHATYLATGIFNIITDFAILLLPMPSLWRLQMPRTKRIATTAVFATGSLACIIAVIRTAIISEKLLPQDYSYNYIIATLWTYAEITIGIIVSSFPILPKFFRSAGPKLLGKLPFVPKSDPVIQPSSRCEPTMAGSHRKQLFWFEEITAEDNVDMGTSETQGVAFSAKVAGAQEKSLELKEYDVMPTAPEKMPVRLDTGTRRCNREDGRDG